MNLTNNTTSTSGSRDISMPIVHNILINPMITLDNKDFASLTLLGVSYIFLASDHENHC